MKEVVVLSVKGGTGKTSFVGSFAALAQSKVLADCDVDAADLYLILKPKIKGKHELSGLKIGVPDRVYDSRRCREMWQLRCLIGLFQIISTASLGIQPLTPLGSMMRYQLSASPFI